MGCRYMQHYGIVSSQLQSPSQQLPMLGACALVLTNTFLSKTVSVAMAVLANSYIHWLP